MLIEKEIAAPGTYWYTNAAGTPLKLDVTPELTHYWHDQGTKMISAGLTIPVPYEHDFTAHPMTPKDKLLNNAGEVKEYKLKGNTLFGVVDVQDPDVKHKIGKSIRWTSPWINSFTDGNGKQWNNVISHLALTTRPRIVKQAPFESMAAALSIATSVRAESAATDSGYCLSKAGLITDGTPAYPMAFSMLSGIPLSQARKPKGPGGGQFTKAGAETKSAHNYTQRLHKRSPTTHSDDALKESHAAIGNGSTEERIKHHEKAAEHHFAAAKHHKDRGEDRAHFSHMTAGEAHEDAAESIGHPDTWKNWVIPGYDQWASSERNSRNSKRSAAMAIGDIAKKPGKPQPGAKEAPPEKKASEKGGPQKGPLGKESSGDTPDGLEDAQGDMDTPGGEEGDDTQNDADQPPMTGGVGEIQIEELLCDLLQALGVPMPDETNEQEFKRHLYEAVMSKIKELTSEGMGQAKKDKFEPDQNKPPNQQPNAAQPKANPIIQQEQQPMYMSLDDINKLDDPLKSVALSMYNQTVKAEAKAAEYEKTLNSLRDVKLKEESVKRANRISLLGKLSPRVKADLDTIAALPTMALSMGEGGTVIDPMAQTLAVLEKGLSDLPRLLTTDVTALSLQAHPTDDDSLTDEQSDKLSDDMARMMGCPPEKKAS